MVTASETPDQTVPECPASGPSPGHDAKRASSAGSDAEVSERKWASGGERLASAKYSEKAIEAKELQLRELINKNYGRIRDVEKELAGLQLQLKLTNGPKRGALELLRRKIELQNGKVVLARNNSARAQQVAEEAAEVLKAEERAKDRLCQELNLLIQESAHAQLDKLDQLTARLELLNRDLTSAKAAEAVAAIKAEVAAGDQLVPVVTNVDEAPVETAAADTETNPFLERAADGAQAGTTAAPATSAPPANAGKAAARTDSAQRKEAQRMAAAARARHVQLGAPKKSNSGSLRQALPPQPAGKQDEGAFHGFD